VEAPGGLEGATSGAWTWGAGLGWVETEGQVPHPPKKNNSPDSSSQRQREHTHTPPHTRAHTRTPAAAVYFSQCRWYLDGMRAHCGTPTSSPRFAATTAAACSAALASFGTGWLFDTRRPNARPSCSRSACKPAASSCCCCDAAAAAAAGAVEGSPRRRLLPAKVWDSAAWRTWLLVGVGSARVGEGVDCL